MSPSNSEPFASRSIAQSDLLVWVGVVGFVSSLCAFLAIQPYQVNVVRYRLVPADGASRYLPALMFGVVLLAPPAVTAVLVAAWSGTGGWRAACQRLGPLILSLPLALFVVVESAPPLAFVLLAISGAAATMYLLGAALPIGPCTGRSHAVAVVMIVALIAGLAAMHVVIEVNFWRHLMLGHADIGHFAEELKNVWAGRGLRCDSFENTRLGWHFVPLLYILAPVYAVWPSPVMLMTFGALCLHVVALPLYFAARRASGSVVVAFLFAVSWLLAPSVSRLVYSNTYGFHWVYAALPLTAWMIAAGLEGRWRASAALVVPSLLVRETVAAPVFGWGLYAALFTRRRLLGTVIALLAVAYFACCAAVLIPHFTSSGTYERMSVYGSLGDSPTGVVESVVTQPGAVLERLMRPECVSLLALLLITTAGLPLFGWRLGLAAVPVLIPVLLMENADWLSIKFWHHAAVLPFLFFAGVTLVGRRPASPVSSDTAQTTHGLGTSGAPLGIALALAVASGWGQYLFGFSPVSKSFEAYADSRFLQSPDPRMELVDRLRVEIPKDRTILATERIAAHFWDYRRVYTGRHVRPADFVVIDAADRWDTSGLPQRVAEFAADPHYEVYEEFGSIVVFRCRADTPLAEGEE